MEAWAGEQLPMFSGTGVTIGESWLMDVMLLVTVGLVLLSCACTVFVKHPPTRDAHVMKEPVIAKQESCMTLRSMRDETINHVEERTWSLSPYSGDQMWQLMEVLEVRFCRDTLLQF